MLSPAAPGQPNGFGSSAPISPEQLFARRRQDAPSAPLITFYDDETGERAELSASSLGNWIAKTHFLVLDALGLQPGGRAVVRTPVHWLAAPIVFGCWFAGLQVLTSPPDGAAELLLADAGSLAGFGERSDWPADEVFAVSLLSMARPDQPPAGAEDFTSAVRPMPDAWPSVQPQAGPDAAALDGLSRREVVERATLLAAEFGLQAGGRLLWTTDWDEPAGRTDALIGALLAPLAAGGSVVLVRHPDPRRLDQRISSERITAVH